MTEVGTLSETRPAHIQTLTSLRFLAALWVVVYHLRPHMEAMIPWWEHLRPLTDNGYLGVDLFFVLSGFIITHTYAGRLERPTVAMYRYFLGLRLARMYPVHLVTLLALVVLVGGARVLGRGLDGDFSLVAFVRQLLLVTAWGPDSTLLSWNYPAWSISAEWAAYLAFPLLAVGLRSVRSVRASVLGAVVVLAGYLAVLALGLPGFVLLQVAVEFTVGFFLCRVFVHLRGGRRWDVVAGLAVLVVVLAVTLGPADPSPFVIPALAVVILGLAVTTGPLRSLLSRPAFVFLGEASYSLYMTHAIVIFVGAELLPMEAREGSGIVAKVVVLLVYAALLLAAAVATYLLVERPSRDAWRRRLVGPGVGA